MAYAERTEVPVARSREQIETLLVRHGASEFASGWEQNRRAVIQFKIEGLQVRLELKMPNRDDYLADRYGCARADTTVESHWQREMRRRWRALLLVIKAKLEAVESGISTLEQEFLAGMLLPDGTTLGEWVAPMLPEINRTMPPLLPGAAHHHEGAGR